MSVLANPETFKPLLQKLITRPQDFSIEDTRAAIEHIAQSDGALPAQIGSFLTALHLSGKDAQPETISACAQVMRAHSIPVYLEGAREDFVVDIVGTGGDGHNTFNVSTAAAIVAAGAGARVCKHGNRAATSPSGSADILMALGCTLPPPSPLPFPRIPFIFLLAAHYHPSLIALSSIRKSLPIRTVFNILGPLINPAQPRGMLLGVNSPDLGPIFIEALKELGVKRAMVVCGHEHLDEISIAGDTWAWSLDEEGEIKSLNLHPSQFGLPVHPLSEVKSSTPSENAALLTAMLTSTDPPPLPDGSSYDGIRNFILLNAAALLALAGIAKSFEDGVELARRSISEGRAWAALDAFRSMGAVQPDNIIPTKKASEPM